MDTASTIAGLEREWDFDSGFFGGLRRGEFDTASLNRLIETLELIDLQDGVTVNRRVVSLLWYMPIFMGWQTERVQESGGDIVGLDKAINRIQTLLEGILGIP